MEQSWYRRHPGIVRVLAILIPLIAAGVLHSILSIVPTTSAAIVLVLFVVASAATGDRLAGVLAAASSALGFDYFLTQPYLQLRIDSSEDIELALLLLIVGLAVSELASWGVRQGAAATEQASFVQGALKAADLAAGSTSHLDGLERMAESIKGVLGVDQVTYEYGEHDGAAAVIQRDGLVRYRGKSIDVTLTGLPNDPGSYTAIPVVQRGAQVGYFRIIPGANARPGRDALRVGVLLAGEWSLRATPTSPTPTPGTAKHLANPN